MCTSIATSAMIWSGKVCGIRFATLARMCAVLECRPGELLDYESDPADLERDVPETPSFPAGGS